MKVCIVGGVAGGASAAARLRRLNEHWEIIIFEKDEYISFANCGLPYHISKKIEKRDALILQTPEKFNQRFNIDVRINNKVTDIDPQKKIIKVQDLKSGKAHQESYDKLILSPGAAPFVPPIKGVEKNIFFTLRNIPDMDKIIAHINEKEVKEAVVIGGGFIGIEVSENLHQLGIKVTIVELLDQLMMPLDLEMANIIHSTLKDKGINLYLKNGVKEITENSVILNSNQKIKADLVIGAVGIRPENHLAQNAGLELGETGGILVDDHMKTSDPDIYAVGDVVEIKHLVSEVRRIIPLAGPANKQGRLAADNISGIETSYKNTQGTGIVKIFDKQVASSGINEKEAKDLKINYQAIHIHPNNHAGYYPGASSMTLKVIFNTENGRILGAQGIGNDGVDKRIDLLAMAIRSKMTVFDLEEMELSYAPPFGSAKDPINMIGFVGSNILRGIVRSVTWDQVKDIEDSFILDVRTEAEVKKGAIPDSYHIPVDELRKRHKEIPKGNNIIIYCRSGVRSYIGFRILFQEGLKDIYNLSGGYLTYQNYDN